MSDLIKREDAIEALCKGCGWKESQCDQDSGFWCESGALIRRDIPSADRPQGEWIPCSERLPEEDVAVLVTTKENYRLPKWTESKTYEMVSIASWDREDGWSTKRVLAWMPLPKPFTADTPQTDKNCDNCGTPRDKCVYCIEEDRMWTPQTDCTEPIECKDCNKHICYGCEHQAEKEVWRKAQTDCGWK